MTELINDGKNGFLVSCKDEAVKAVSRIGDISRLECRKTVESRFTVERMVEEYVAVYERVLERTQREDHRPWGYYCVLADEPDHKVKRIVVYPGQRVSLQRHRLRAEHWFIVQGQAVITRDGEEISAESGQAVDIPHGTWHRIKNPGCENMVFIEVQRGDYFGEDDIERMEDDYGRT